MSGVFSVTFVEPWAVCPLVGLKVTTGLTLTSPVSKSSACLEPSAMTLSL